MCLIEYSEHEHGYESCFKAIFATFEPRDTSDEILQE
jgi:hypothetical protein